MVSVKCNTVFLMGKQIGLFCLVLFCFSDISQELTFQFPIVNCGCPLLKSTGQRCINVCVEGGSVEDGVQ